MLFCWVVLGWLAPTLVLLPPKPHFGAGARLLRGTEEALRLLLPSSHRHGQSEHAQRWLDHVNCGLVWAAVLLGAWGVSCLAAPFLV